MSKQKKTNEKILKEVLIPEDEQWYEVPENWIWTKFGTVAKLYNGYAFKSTDYQEAGLPVIRISDISGEDTSPQKAVRVPPHLFNERFLVRKGDLLIAMSGATTGKTGVYNSDEIALQNQRVGNIKEISQNVLCPKYKNYFVFNNSNEILKKAYGGAQPNISGALIEQLSFPLPPLNEQKRISEKVERLLGKIEEAKQLIKEAKETFELRRSSIWDKAFRGELTSNWRKKSVSTTPIEKTLEIIKEANSNLNNKITKFSELNELPFAVPDRWKWVKLHQICLSLKNGLYKPASYYSDSGTPCLRMYNIDNNELNLKDIHYMTLTNEEIEEYGLKYGDILINRVNSRELVGKCAPVLKDFPTSVYESKNIRIRLHDEISTEFVSGFLNSIYVKKWINESCKQTVGMATINQEFLKNLLIPLPPVEEQKQIMDILNHILLNENKIKEILKATEKLDVLKETILSKAFRGELGTNDPSEESAIELLKEVLQEQVK